MPENPLDKYAAHLRTIAFFLAAFSMAFFALQLSGQGIVPGQLQKNIDGLRRLWDSHVSVSDISDFELEGKVKALREQSIEHFVNARHESLENCRLQAVLGDDEIVIGFYGCPYVVETQSGQEIGFTSGFTSLSWAEAANPKMNDIIKLWDLLRGSDEIYLPLLEKRGFIVKDGALIQTTFFRIQRGPSTYRWGRLTDRQAVLEHLRGLEDVDRSGFHTLEHSYFFTTFDSDPNTLDAIVPVSLSAHSVDHQWQIADGFQLIIDKSGRFRQSFPRVHELIVTNPGLRLNEFEEMVEATSKYRSEGTLELFGIIRLQGKELKTIGAAALLIVQLYFLLHFVEFAGQDAIELRAIRFPWLALYRPWVFGAFFLVSVCGAPILPAAYEFYVFGFSYRWVFYSLWSVAASAGIIFAYRKTRIKRHRVGGRTGFGPCRGVAT
ncbi:MAG: hypothetical protein JW993_00700 [Sedimentisphaerales bacterium]|nr:hypothetical protein [Sedimentisphaerales bacterium]